MFLRPNGKEINYICHNTKISTFMANFKTLHIGCSVTGFEEKILMFDEVNENFLFTYQCMYEVIKGKHKHIYIFKQTIALFKEVINIS